MPTYEIFINGKPRKIELTRSEENSFTVQMDDKTLNIDLPVDKLNLDREFAIKVDDKTYKVELPKINRGKFFSVKVEEATFKAEVKISTRKITPAIFEPTRITRVGKATASKQVTEGVVIAPMTGKILSVMVKKGDEVKARQILCILEAMKMENEITTTKAGTVKDVLVSEGSSVSEGEVLFVVD